MKSKITRDHFAMEAMKVLLSSSVKDDTPFWRKIVRVFRKSVPSSIKAMHPNDVARKSYEFADAMIEEREKVNSEKIKNDLPTW